MSGIYIHIPYCKIKCSYCDFYSIANRKNIDVFLQCLQKEIVLRKNEFQNNEISTIYFGGGTPSLLTINQINNILKLIFENYKTTANPEITLEANPDDLNYKYLVELRTKTKINRLSIGIQSFDNEDLKLMKRRHTAEQTIECIELAQILDFNNISVDLIYGLPNQTIEKWNVNLDKTLNLDIQHISAYHLTYEKGTQFYKMLKNKKISELDENLSLEMFYILIEKTKKYGFEHYEISNFCLPEKYSKHNTSYWKQKQYLGFGPSAHSFDMENRSWNFSDLNKYCDFLNDNKLPSEIEVLNIQNKYNEYVMTSLRTKWGINLDYIKQNFEDKYVKIFLKTVEKYLEQDLIKIENSNYILTFSGIFISDHIISDFFIID